MLVDKAGKNLDDLGRVFQALDHSQHVTDRDGKTLHGSLSSVESGVELPQGMGDFFEKENNLDTDNGGDSGENGNGDKTDDLGQGHEYKCKVLSRKYKVEDLIFLVTSDEGDFFFELFDLFDQTIGSGGKNGDAGGFAWKRATIWFETNSIWTIGKYFQTFF